MSFLDWCRLAWWYALRVNGMAVLPMWLWGRAVYNMKNIIGIELQRGLDIQKLQYSDIPCLHSELAGADIARWLQELSSMVYLVRRSGVLSLKFDHWWPFLICCLASGFGDHVEGKTMVGANASPPAPAAWQKKWERNHGKTSKALMPERLHPISSKSQTDAGIQLYFDEQLGVHIFGKSKCC